MDSRGTCTTFIELRGKYISYTWQGHMRYFLAILSKQIIVLRRHIAVLHAQGSTLAQSPSELPLTLLIMHSQ